MKPQRSFPTTIRLSYLALAALVRIFSLTNNIHVTLGSGLHIVTRIAYLTSNNSGSQPRKSITIKTKIKEEKFEQNMTAIDKKIKEKVSRLVYNHCHMHLSSQAWKNVIRINFGN